MPEASKVKQEYDNALKNEENDRNSAMATLKSVLYHVEYQNYNAALSALGSIAIMLASAETNSRLRSQCIRLMNGVTP